MFEIVYARSARDNASAIFLSLGIIRRNVQSINIFWCWTPISVQCSFYLKTIPAKIAIYMSVCVCMCMSSIIKHLIIHGIFSVSWNARLFAVFCVCLPLSTQKKSTRNPLSTLLSILVFAQSASIVVCGSFFFRCYCFICYFRWCTLFRCNGASARASATNNATVSHAYAWNLQLKVRRESKIAIAGAHFEYVCNGKS